MSIGATEAAQSTGAFPTETAGGQELGKEEFLKLLVAQLQHQDPLEPMSNSEFVAQLAQFSNVEQLVAVNEGINMLGIQQMGMTNAQASSFIGKEVEVRSDQLNIESDDSSATAGFKLAENATSVEVNIRDATGAIVRTIELGPQSKGEVSFDWNCLTDAGLKVPAGTYRIDIVASNASGAPVSWESRVRGTVDGVSYDAGYPELLIGSIKTVLSNVLGVYPEKETTNAEAVPMPTVFRK